MLCVFSVYLCAKLFEHPSYVAWHFGMLTLKLQLKFGTVTGDLTYIHTIVNSYTLLINDVKPVQSLTHL